MRESRKASLTALCALFRSQSGGGALAQLCTFVKEDEHVDAWLEYKEDSVGNAVSYGVKKIRRRALEAIHTEDLRFCIQQTKEAKERWALGYHEVRYVVRVVRWFCQPARLWAQEPLDEGLCERADRLLMHLKSVERKGKERSPLLRAMKTVLDARNDAQRKKEQERAGSLDLNQQHGYPHLDCSTMANENQLTISRIHPIQNNGHIASGNYISPYMLPISRYPQNDQLPQHSFQPQGQSPVDPRDVSLALEHTMFSDESTTPYPREDQSHECPSLNQAQSSLHLQRSLASHDHTVTSRNYVSPYPQGYQSHQLPALSQAHPSLDSRRGSVGYGHTAPPRKYISPYPLLVQPQHLPQFGPQRALVNYEHTIPPGSYTSPYYPGDLFHQLLDLPFNRAQLDRRGAPTGYEHTMLFKSGTLTDLRENPLPQSSLQPQDSSDLVFGEGSVGHEQDILYEKYASPYSHDGLPRYASSIPPNEGNSV